MPISKPSVATNEVGDVLICRDGGAATFIKAGATEHRQIRDRLAVACIAMLLLAHAEFRQPTSVPDGFPFILDFHVPRSGVRVGIFQGDLVMGHGEWLQEHYDLIVVRNSVHLLRNTAAAAMLAGAVGFELET